jgi:hypothetical protein
VHASYRGNWSNDDHIFWAICVIRALINSMMYKMFYSVTQQRFIFLHICRKALCSWIPDFKSVSVFSYAHFKFFLVLCANPVVPKATLNGDFTDIFAVYLEAHSEMLGF